MVNGGAEEANDTTPASDDTGDHVRDLGLRTDDGADHRALLSQAVSVTAALGMADELASGPRPVEEVAAAGRSLFDYLGHHPDAAELFDGAMADLSRGWIAAVEDDGRVLLAEALLPDGVAPSPAKVMDLAMLAVTPGGRHASRPSTVSCSDGPVRGCRGWSRETCTASRRPSPRSQSDERPDPHR